MKSRHRLPIAALGLALALTLFVGSAVAAPISTTSRPLAPALGFAPPYNTYLLVWAEDRGTGTGLDLYAARVTSTGIVVGREIALVVAAGDQSDPAVAYNARMGDYFVVYTQSGGAGPDVPDPNPPQPGQTASPPPFPSPPGPPVVGQASAFTAAVGPRALVPGAWAVVGPGTHRALATVPVPTTLPPTLPPPPPPPPPGTALPTPQPPGPPAPGSTPTPGGPAVPPPPTAPGSRDIWGVWVSHSGIPLTNTFALIAAPSDDTFPSIAYRLTQGQFDQWALVWREVTGVDVKLRTVELAGFGRFMSFDGGIGTLAQGADHGRPSLARLDTGEYLAVWSQTQAGKSQRDILGRQLNLNAYPIGPTRKIVVGDADQVYPSLAALSGSLDGFLMTWEERAVGAPPDIRIRRVNRNGVPLRAAYDVQAGPPFSFAPSLPSTDRSTTLLVWVDRNAASDHSIMGSEITRDGRRIGPIRTIIQGGTGPGAVTPVVPPPGFPTPPGPPVP